MPTPDRRDHHGRTVINRAEILRRTGAGASTVGYWYAHRDHTGHPEPVTRINRADYFDETDWQTWYDRYRACTPLTEVHASGDPDELVDAAGAARILGYTSGRAILDYLYKRPPGYFPNPDHVEELPSGRQRRRWRRRTILAWAATRDRRGGGRPQGTPQPDTMRTEHPYATDPAYPIALARLRAGPPPTGPQLAAELGIPVEKARRVLRAARQALTHHDSDPDHQ